MAPHSFDLDIVVTIWAFEDWSGSGWGFISLHEGGKFGFSFDLFSFGEIIKNISVILRTEKNVFEVVDSSEFRVEYVSDFGAISLVGFGISDD